MSQFPQQPAGMGYSPNNLKPHRGTLILVMGILGLVVCIICGIIAWVTGNSDLREMQEGTMDPSGEGLTKAGKICGMIAVILNLVFLGIWLLIMLFAIGAGAAGI